MSILDTHDWGRGCAIGLLLCALHPSPSVLAADRGIGVYVDQDLYIPGVNEDRDYTMGLAVEFFWQGKGLYVMDPIVQQIGEWLGLHQPGDTIERSFMLGSINYTPDDLSVRAPILKDRPYASLIYLSNKRVRANPDVAAGVEFRLGMLGTGVAGAVQSDLHRWWREAVDNHEPVEPRGWSHQISDGGELTGRIRLAYSKRLGHGSAGPLNWDVAGSTSMSVGYQSNATLGLTIRSGRLGSSFWTVPFDPINRGAFLPSRSNSEWYFWAGYRTRLVGYDAMLQGQFRNSAVTVDPDSMERIVHEAAVGLTAAWKPVQVTFVVNAKTAEIDSGGARRSHYWGGTYFVVRF